MASNLLPFRPSGIYASTSERRRPDPNRRSSSSSSGWWAPLFGWSSEPDYIDSTGGTAPAKLGKARSASEPGHNKTSGTTRFAPGCFTDEKAKQLRKMTLETASFHDAMYHSAIASRLASDFASAQPDL
ncbi:uncharacterized protein LOC116201976 [Punica granatum]|uniref:DUF4005 domain-containing protein n=2 Tax=Punica granatum TaxID=22663 RepID=A0A218W0A7_PUNGR|nr:uncharacterized protein LOC116201976 [Punica granatum]OWM65983.1 hypothetical protein CDL15_Pgr015408 [Punica granatum]PKI66716.1 hypothetical protein CRG98_012911 [Punica granatum]